MPTSSALASAKPNGQVEQSFADLKDLLAEGDSDSVERIVSELHLNDIPQRATS